MKGEEGLNWGKRQKKTGVSRFIKEFGMDCVLS
jgi:hypothetical protein